MKQFTVRAGELRREGPAISTRTPYSIIWDRNTLRPLTWRGSKPGLPRLCFDFSHGFLELLGLDFFPLHREKRGRYSQWRVLKPNHFWAESFNVVSGKFLFSWFLQCHWSRFFFFFPFCGPSVYWSFNLFFLPFFPVILPCSSYCFIIKRSSLSDHKTLVATLYLT